MKSLTFSPPHFCFISLSGFCQSGSNKILGKGMLQWKYFPFLISYSSNRKYSMNLWYKNKRAWGTKASVAPYRSLRKFGMLLKIINLVLHSSLLLSVVFLLPLAFHFTILLLGRLGCNGSPAHCKQDTLPWSQWFQGLCGLLLTSLMLLVASPACGQHRASGKHWEHFREGDLALTRGRGWQKAVSL